MYLISKDYQRIIQTSELNAITSNDISIRVLVEGSVQSEVYAWLKQRFDLDSTAYNPASTFVLNSLTLINGLVYYCSTAIVVPEVFNGANWTLLGTQYDLFFVTPPEQLFDEMTVYKVGDKVFWRNKVYTSLKDSVREDQQNALQASSIESIGLGNVLPDDRTNGLSFWGVGIAYSVAVGTYPIDITKWTKGDNRNQMFVTIIMVIVVYNLCSRIAPNNVPEARHNAWVKALKDIKDMASGDINAQLPIIQPAIGNRIQFGGDQRQINSW